MAHGGEPRVLGAAWELVMLDVGFNTHTHTL